MSQLDLELSDNERDELFHKGDSDASETASIIDDSFESADESAPHSDAEADQKDESEPLRDINALKQRIEDTVQALTNRTASKVSHSSLLRTLTKDLSLLYSYSEDLAGYFLEMFSPAEAVQFMEANERQRPLTIRANTLKVKRRVLAQQLIARGATVEPVGDWSKLGLTVTESTVPVGATPEYLAGKYMIQSASSLLPVMALGPLPGETVVDMAAAPGGKTTHIGQAMENQGVLFANDFKADRIKSLVANLHRLGITNSVVSNLDGRELPRVLPKVDRVLLDAPCSGSGIISRDPSIKVKRGREDFLENAKLQRELILAAVDLIDAESKTGGYLVYSTCSVSVEENEAVVDYLLKRRNVRLVPFDEEVPFGVSGMTAFKGEHFHPSLKLARRFYPHVHNLDGFFVCKIQKVSNDQKIRIKKDRRHDSEVTGSVWGDKELANRKFTEDVIDFEAEATAAAANAERAGKRPRKEVDGDDRKPFKNIKKPRTNRAPIRDRATETKMKTKREGKFFKTSAKKTFGSLKRDAAAATEKQ